MKENTFLLNTLLAAVVGVALLAAVVVKTFAPWLRLPAVDIPLMAGLSLVVVLLEHYLASSAPRSWPVILLLAAATFGLLPWAAGYVPAVQAPMLAVVGGGVFTLATWLFTFACERMTSGGVGKAAPVVTAVCLFLAGQGFAGMLL